jgi:ABC-type multidrug transport system permease subunit
VLAQIGKTKVGAAIARKKDMKTVRVANLTSFAALFLAAQLLILLMLTLIGVLITIILLGYNVFNFTIPYQRQQNAQLQAYWATVNKRKFWIGLIVGTLALNALIAAALYLFS